jgi:hypothetical protein
MAYFHKFQRKPLNIQGFSTRNHVFCGVTWPVIGSKGDKYEVEMRQDGFTCTCTGFTMHGNCKHIAAIHARIIDENYPRYRA